MLSLQSCTVQLCVYVCEYTYIYTHTYTDIFSGLQLTSSLDPGKGKNF